MREKVQKDGMYLETKLINNMYEGNNNHKDSMEVGHQFQDFIINQFIIKYGIVISIYSSRKYQYDIGESRQGFEIKYDARSTGDSTHVKCTPTNLVAIEVFEKTNPNNTNWVKSGILRDDNTTFYIIGNYHKAWWIEKKILQQVYNLEKYEVKQTRDTIKSLLIPIEYMDAISIDTLIFNSNLGRQSKLGL